jgi:hypothetical protein
MTEDALLAVLFTALGKFGEKEGRRELLKAGSYQVLIRMSGDVNDTGFNGVKLAGTLSVGEDGVQPGSVAMPPDQIVGYFLGMLRPKAREQILRTLPDACAKPGEFPDVDPERVKEAKSLLTRLRARVDRPVRGAVSFKVEKLTTR